MPPSICIFGDLMLDVVTHLDHVDPMNFDDLYVTNPIELFPGGTGVIAALAATQQGFSKVVLIGKVGAFSNGKVDVAAQIIFNELNQAGVESVLGRDTNRSTGTAMITYFSQNRRILVADKGANGAFTLEDVTLSILRHVATTDILYISGFSLLLPEQAQAVVRLTEEAKKHGCLVVLDVVPHKLYETVNSSLFQIYTQHVGVLVSNTATLKRLFPKIASCRTIGDEEHIAQYLLHQYDALILRPDIDHQMIFNTSGLRKESSTGFSQADPTHQRGYLDRLTIRSLYECYDAFRQSGSFHG